MMDDILGEIFSGPPKISDDVGQRELFAFLRAASGWTVPDIEKGLNHFLLNEEFVQSEGGNPTELQGIGKSTIDSWLYNNVVPQKLNRAAFIELLHRRAGEFSKDWISAFVQVWATKVIDKDREEERKKEKDHLLSLMQRTCLQNRQLTHLPSLFETEQPLPLASSFVELAMVETLPLSPAPNRLTESKSLSQIITDRIERRYAARRSPKDLFDRPGANASLILGDPGAGKSSLMKRIALEIAGGDWENSKVPLFIEARAFWRAKAKNPTLTLLSLGLSNLAASSGVAIESMQDIIFEETEERSIAVLLVDGLDEIANVPEAVDSIYEELRNLPMSMPWIATCRPTGLVASPGETFRCEIIELDDRSIENLVRNWCKAVSNPQISVSADPLLQEIFGSSSNREIARNPFLLTALCFLKSQSPDEALPTTRIEVYSELFERVGQQARFARNDSRILNPIAYKNLEEFSYFLYLEKQATQVFSGRDWAEFSSDNANEQTDFKSEILPARLLTTWNVGTDLFHFVHLSLQEFLVAKHLLNESIEFALSLRFRPVWRPIFRFYGALLLANGQKETFRLLVAKLFEERDFTGFSYLTVAEIFADIGIRDTTEWIGEDLRPKLYAAAEIAEEVAPEALIDALAILDPDWLSDQAHKKLANRLDYLASVEDYEEYTSVGVAIDSPYQQLARARTPEACETLRKTMFGENTSEAIFAAHSFEMIATAKDRQVAISRIMPDPSDNPFIGPFLAFADASRRPELLPALRRISKWYRGGTQSEYRTILKAITQIGTKEALKLLGECLKYEATHSDKDVDYLELILRNISELGGDDAKTLLLKAKNYKKLKDEQHRPEILSLCAVPNDIKLARKYLLDATTRNAAIDALSGAANYGRPVDDGICEIIAKSFKFGQSTDIRNIALLEGARLDGGQKPKLCEAILDGLKLISQRYLDPAFEDDKAMLETNFSIGCDTLARAPYLEARPLTRELLSNPDTPVELLLSVIELSGSLFEGTHDSELVKKLTEFWYAAPEDFSLRVALAIGRIDLNALFRLQSAYNADNAIEQISGARSVLVFDDFYTDKTGQIYQWIDPPKGILFICPDEEFEDTGNLAHELSKLGYCAMEKDHTRCRAAVIFPGAQEDADCQNLLEVFLENSKVAKERPLFHQPVDLGYDDISNFASEIGEKLSTCCNKT